MAFIRKKLGDVYVDFNKKTDLILYISNKWIYL